MSESEKQRLNRNLDQLLQELRVVLPGVQVLFAFLLAVPFSSRFGDVDDFERDVYFVALLLSAIAVALLMAPSIQHRILFRHDQKRYLVSARQHADDRRHDGAGARDRALDRARGALPVRHRSRPGSPAGCRSARSSLIWYALPIERLRHQR